MNVEKSNGLYGKFWVSRVDGKDLHGNSKQEAEYFVLDYVHDPFARQALQFYAFVCQIDYPELSSDLWIKLRDTAEKFREKQNVKQ